MADMMDRLTLSRVMLERWHAAGGPTGRPEELLCMVKAEIALLQSLSGRHPDVRELILDWQAVARGIAMRHTQLWQ